MPDDLRLFADDGVLKPPGVPPEARPGDDRTYDCPLCGRQQMVWWMFTEADCDCGYRWKRSGQLDHTEELPL